MYSPGSKESKAFSTMNKSISLCGILRSRKRLFTHVVFFLLLAGCANPGFEERRDDSQRLRSSLEAETRAILDEAGGRLSLSNAVALVRERSLKTVERELDATLARVNRATAFSAFLPNVEMAYGRGVFSNLKGAYPPYSFDAGRTFGDGASITLTQPVFTPVAWIMFAESQYGVRVNDLLVDRAREMLDAATASLYHEAVIADRLRRTYAIQLASDAALTNRLAALVREGFALGSDAARAKARLAFSAVSLHAAEDAAATARAKLCETMRLWPLASFEVDGDSLAAVTGLPWTLKGEDGAAETVDGAAVRRMPLEEIVWQSLVNRKELYAADQMVELRKAQVLEALAGFLPNVMAEAGGQRMTMEHLSARYWNGALMGTWAAFEGFKSVQNYRAARARREAEFRLREDRMLAVVTSTVEAWCNWKRADEELAAAEAVRAAAESVCSDAERLFEEGEETMSHVLDRRAERDAAQVQSEKARYALALSEVALRQAMGIGIGF